MSTLSERVVAIIRRIGDLQSLDSDEDFYAAGFESVKALEVLLELEEEFAVTIPDDEFVKRRTARGLGDLVDHLQQKALK